VVRSLSSWLFQRDPSLSSGRCYLGGVRVFVVNTGKSKAVVRVLGLRAVGFERSDQIFDSDVNFDPKVGLRSRTEPSRRSWTMRTGRRAEHDDCGAGRYAQPLLN
jgi:hypothetical protein